MKKLYLSICLAMLMSLFLFNACDEEDTPAPVENNETIAKVNSCEGCHTNYEHLKEVHTPDPPSEGDDHGCGGPPPYYEPYDRVYMDGAGYAEFKASPHGKLDCVYCHNGVDDTADKAEAHSGNFMKKPSLDAEEKCGSCHASIVERAENSLHSQGWGQKRMVIQRSGTGEGTSETLPEDWAKLHEGLEEGYNENCMKCHANCGECHIVRPNAMGGGLENGHAFIKTPDMRNSCVGCHSSRGGHAYFGQAIGTEPDVHLAKAGFTCMDCHSQNEVHGTGEVQETRYKMPLLPECSDCHGDLSNDNSYHTMHFDTFNCQTCHSQDYNNCGNCHIGDGGAQVESHQKFKIAMNPIPEIKPYKMATVRQSLMGPNSWTKYGVSDLPNFASNPTYKYTTPHNILRWTERTDTTGGKLCFESCHIGKDDEGNFINKEFYLFEEDLDYEWEMPANKDIIVDGRLPNSWGVN